ncbi:MAG: TadE/TadG family type IV pilus assembly protein, partial [Actinomycetota bacterium]
MRSHSVPATARGSVSVEFAAVLPLVAISMLLVAQVGVLVVEELSVLHAAREGARAAAIYNDDARARDVVLQAGNLDPERARIQIDPAWRDVGTSVRVSVWYRPAAVPFA